MFRFSLVLMALLCCGNSYAEDLGFRFKDGKCVNEEGKEGLNPYRFGQCGDFRGAGLIGFEFEKQDFSGSDFSGADLSRSKFDSVTLKGVKFSQTTLREVRFRGVTFENSTIENADLSFANFYSVAFSNVQLKNVDFYRLESRFTVYVTNSTWENVSFHSGEISLRAQNSMLKNIDFYNVSGSLSLDESKILDSDFRQSRMTYIQLKGKTSFKGSVVDQMTVFRVGDGEIADYKKLEIEKVEAPVVGISYNPTIVETHPDGNSPAYIVSQLLSIYGFTVKKFEKITEEVLKEVDVFISTEKHYNGDNLGFYTEAEVAAMQAWIRRGGRFISLKDDDSLMGQILRTERLEYIDLIYAREESREMKIHFDLIKNSFLKGFRAKSLSPFVATSRMELAWACLGEPEKFPKNTKFLVSAQFPEFVVQEFPCVAEVPHGQGEVIYLGYNFKFVPPFGDSGAEWVEILKRAVLVQ